MNSTKIVGVAYPQQSSITNQVSLFGQVATVAVEPLSGMCLRVVWCLNQDSEVLPVGAEYFVVKVNRVTHKMSLLPLEFAERRKDGDVTALVEKYGAEVSYRTGQLRFTVFDSLVNTEKEAEKYYTPIETRLYVETATEAND